MKKSKYESYMIVQNEGFLLQNRVNSRESMKEIEMMFGPFLADEVEFYREVLTRDSNQIINEFQRTLVQNLFLKYFGEPQAFKTIKSDDFIKLMIASKRILSAHGMVILPYVISSKIKSIQNRKNVNKKESIKLDSDELFAKIMMAYKSKSIREFIMSVYATIISSEFLIIDYDDSFVNGKTLPIMTDIALKEINEFIMLIIS